MVQTSQRVKKDEEELDCGMLGCDKGDDDAQLSYFFEE
jgi:hypothetical protein